MTFWALEKQPIGGVDSVENWAYNTAQFSPEECKKIIEIGEALMPNRALTFGETLDSPVSKVRNSLVSWILPQENTAWIFQKLTDVVNAANSGYFNFDLWGFSEGLQFTKYEHPDGKYDVHMDKTHMEKVRKLSIVVQLTDPSEYEGGTLSMFTGSNPSPIVKGVGNVAVFPSYMLHQVDAVTKGTRYSLVAWVTGPKFK